MPRRPKPWYWEARKAWYVQVSKKQIRLHEDKEEAHREYYRIMAASGRLDDRQRKAMTATDVCEEMCASVQEMRASTRRHYAEKLGAFSDQFGHRRLDRITTQEVVRWVRDYRPPPIDAKGRKRRPWGDNSRSMLMGYVKRLYKYARDTGHIDINPFARIENPWKIAARDSPMEPDEYEAILGDLSSSDEFKEVVEFIWKTGARPGELCVMGKRHMDARKMIVRLQPSEHKTGTKTGLQREIFFPPDLWNRLKVYADMRPAGPLLRRPNGKPWTPSTITSSFARCKRRLKLRCVLYQARHSFATDQIERGVPDSRVAKTLGHTHTKTLMKHYYHPDADLIAEDVSATSDMEAERMERIRAEVLAAREEAAAARREHKRRLATEKARRYRAKKAATSSDT